ANHGFLTWLRKLSRRALKLVALGLSMPALAQAFTWVKDAGKITGVVVDSPLDTWSKIIAAARHEGLVSGNLYVPDGGIVKSSYEAIFHGTRAYDPSHALIKLGDTISLQALHPAAIPSPAVSPIQPLAAPWINPTWQPVSLWNMMAAHPVET